MLTSNQHTVRTWPTIVYMSIDLHYRMRGKSTTKISSLWKARRGSPDVNTGQARMELKAWKGILKVRHTYVQFMTGLRP